MRHTRLIGSVTSLFLGAGAAFADFVRPEINYYAVDATTVTGLISQMNARGPRGYWAYAE